MNDWEIAISKCENSALHEKNRTIYVRDPDERQLSRTAAIGQ